MPLDATFAPQLAGSNADLCNVGGRAGGACTAAWFLRVRLEILHFGLSLIISSFRASLRESTRPIQESDGPISILLGAWSRHRMAHTNVVA